ncbi:MAG: ISAs1 family transposase [Spirochaetales bacterium]
MLCAIHKEVDSKKGKSSEWHYYISSKKLTAENLLKHARYEWSVESMHWFLDVHFREDECRLRNETAQKNLNMIRKIVLNSLKLYKQTMSLKKPLNHIMIDCHLNPLSIFDICKIQN